MMISKYAMGEIQHAPAILQVCWGIIGGPVSRVQSGLLPALEVV